MRRILQMCLEMAAAEAKAAEDPNRRVAELREAYSTLDRAFDRENVPRTVLREVLTTADFPYYFGTTLSRRFYDQYQYQVGAWTDYTFADTTPDFREVERLRMSEFDTLELRREKAEAKAGHVFEEKLSYRVREYAKQFDVSWQTIINDDLGKIRQITLLMASSANRFEDAYVSALYDNPTTQAALVALGPNYAGTGRLTAQNLAIGYNAFAQRVDARGNPLNIRPKYLVVPPVLYLQARAILESELIAGLATNDKNVLKGLLEVRIDPYITFAEPDIPWYLFADPAAVPAVTVARLEGYPGPRLYMRESDRIPLSPGGGLGTADMFGGSWGSKDIEYEVEDIIGGWEDDEYVGVTDYQGIYYSDGTTP